MPVATINRILDDSFHDAVKVQASKSSSFDRLVVSALRGIDDPRGLTTRQIQSICFALVAGWVGANAQTGGGRSCDDAAYPPFARAD